MSTSHCRYTKQWWIGIRLQFTPYMGGVVNGIPVCPYMGGVVNGIPVCPLPYQVHSRSYHFWVVVDDKNKYKSEHAQRVFLLYTHICIKCFWGTGSDSDYF